MSRPRLERHLLHSERAILDYDRGPFKRKKRKKKSPLVTGGHHVAVGLLRVRFEGPIVGEGIPTQPKLLFLCDVGASAG